MRYFSFTELWYYFVIIAVVSYFIGCFNFALLISKLKKTDVRKLGSGNPGTMNMSRQFGLKIGLLTLLLDMLKGGIPVLIVFYIFKNMRFAGIDMPIYPLACYTAGISAIIGHIYPVTMRFKGGKGIATTFGMFAFILPCQSLWYLFIVFGALIATLLFIYITKWGGVGSLVGVTLFTVSQCVIFYFAYNNSINWAYITVQMLLLGNACLTFFAHRKNIFAVFRGEERKTLDRKMKKASKV